MDSLWSRIQLELLLGTNTKCLQCGKTFLAHEDGCPDCGMGARTRSTIEPLDYSDCKPDRSKNGYCIFVFENGSFQVVGNDKFNPWPKIEQTSDDDVISMVFDKETGEFHAFDGSLQRK